MNRQTAMLVIVAALGYFVDIYDLVLFNVIKKESLEYLFPDWAPADITSTGMYLFNLQMFGMLIGGLLWGILGDKKGRIQVLFGSILLYSAANIVNAFVTDMTTYSVVRVIAGIGLAGELGAGITLISETMSKEKRGIGTMIVVTFGALGAVVAGVVGVQGDAIGAFLESLFNYPFPNWRVAYIIGGTLGLILLILRIGVLESGMYTEVKSKTGLKRGDFFMLFRSKERFLKYLSCILVGVPIWYTIGLLVANSEEVFGPELGVTGKVINGKAVMYCYIGLSVGDFISGLLSQLLKSRKKVVIAYLVFTTTLIIYFLYFAQGISPEMYYILSFFIGIASGYWALFVIIASEQFGTNIRSTVTNTVPNFVRGSVPIVMASFSALVPEWTNRDAAMLVGAVVMLLSFIAIFYLRESFSKDLNYVEEQE